MKITKRQMEYLDKHIEKERKLELKQLKKKTTNEQVLLELKKMLDIKMTIKHNDNIMIIENSALKGLNGIKSILERKTR